MTIKEWLELFRQQVAETGWLQWIAVILGIAEVLYAKVNKIWLYPTGIAATLLSIYILYVSGLFAEAVLNLYYFIMSIYGWIHWVKKKTEPPVEIAAASTNDWIMSLLIVVGGGLVMYVILAKYTSSTVPFWDAWVSATAWAGMWLLAKRKLENWILLNLSNIFAIPLLMYKHLPLFAALTVFLFIVGCQGYIKWRKLMLSKMI